MDMAGPMPDEAWYEIRDAEGVLLMQVPATIDGGAVRAELPAFPPGTRGRVELCMRWGSEEPVSEPEDLKELPTTPTLTWVQMG